MNIQVTPQAILQQSNIIHSSDAVEQAIAKVVNLIHDDFGQSPIILICVMNGGLYFSGKLLSKLRMPIKVDYVHASRYQHDLKGNILQWSKYPSLDLKHKSILLVDDILDEGVTLAAVSEHCLSLGAKQVCTAVLVDKDNGIQKPIKADYVGLPVPNAFVFGCGMDAYGWWRNLSEIRALA